MHVLQHSQRANHIPGGDMNNVGHRTSVCSSASDFSQQVEQKPSHHQTGPYMEGNMKLLATIGLPTDVMCNRYSDDGSLLAVGLTNGTINIYETYPLTCNHLHTLQDEDTKKFHLPVTNIRFKHFEENDKPEYKHIIMASYASGEVKFWHYTTGKCLSTINDPECSQILSIAINPENDKFIYTGDNPRIHVHDMYTQQRVLTLEPSDGQNVMDGHKERCFSMMYHPIMPHAFISGGWDDTVQFWDDRKRHAYQHISGPHICGDSLDIDPRHNHILTGSWCTATTLQIWDFSSTKLIKNVPVDPMNNTRVYCCQWLGSDSIISGGDTPNMARIIDRGTLNTTGQLLDLEKAVYCIDNDRHGNHPKVAIGSNKYIYIVREEKKSS